MGATVCQIWKSRLFAGQQVSWPWRHHVDIVQRHIQEAELSADPVGCCWCLKLRLFGHCVALICPWHWRHIKAEKGTRRALSGRRAYDWSGKRLTARTLGLFWPPAEELAPSEAWTSAETRKESSKDKRRSVLPFVCVCRACQQALQLIHLLLSLFFQRTHRCYYFL